MSLTQFLNFEVPHVRDIPRFIPGITTLATFCLPLLHSNEQRDTSSEYHYYLVAKINIDNRPNYVLWFYRKGCCEECDERLMLEDFYNESFDSKRQSRFRNRCTEYLEKLVQRGKYYESFEEMRDFIRKNEVCEMLDTEHDTLENISSLDRSLNIIFSKIQG